LIYPPVGVLYGHLVPAQLRQRLALIFCFPGKRVNSRQSAGIWNAMIYGNEK
jgi:hypothetical protein